MFRLVFLVGLFGLLAQAAVPSRDSSLVDSAYNPSDGGSSSSEQTAQTGSVWSWLTNSWNSVRSWFGWEPNPILNYRPFPPYQELCDPRVSFGYQAREYGASVWVAVTVNSPYSDVAVLFARPKLENYFNGGNDRGLKIRMTTPLRLKSPPSTSRWGPDIEQKTLVYYMYLPPELHANPPEPNDTDVVILREQARKYFVITFPSYNYAFLDFQKRGELVNLLDEQREEYQREFFFVDVYNTRWEVTGRQNEVLLLFSPNVATPNCAPRETVPAAPRPGVTAAVITSSSEPEYKQLCSSRTTEYDAREYKRAVWISTTVNAVSSDVGKFDAFPKLDRYFDGNNDQGVKIQNTYPVRITQEWPKSPYIFEVFRDYTYAYYLPPELYKNIPEPLDPAVSILDEPAATMFALNYTGFTFEFKDQQMLIRLQNLLDEAGESYMSSWRWARNQYYYSTQIFGRRNDILVYMDPHLKTPQCTLEEGEFPPCEHRGKDCPSYRVLQSLTDDIQRRHFSGNLYVLRRTNTCNMSAAYSTAYMPLHRYFRGANSRNENITRVPPVVLVHKSKENPPEGCDFTYNLMFHMPTEAQRNPPEPTEVGTELFRIEAREVFVMTFQEKATQDLVDTKVARMKTELDSRALCYDKDEFALASFDAPWRPLPHRREIWIVQADCTQQVPEQNPTYSIQAGSGCSAETLCPMYQTVGSHPTFEERVYQTSLWVCKATTSCDVEDAFNDAITPLYEYFQALYEVEPIARPVWSYLSVSDFKSIGCNKVITTCAFLPEAGRLPLTQPGNGMKLEYHAEEGAPRQPLYVTNLEGPSTVENINSGITTLLLAIQDANLNHNNVFVFRYTLPRDEGEPKTEVGAYADSLAYQI
ncbi:uncharacterized protein LOC110990259 [Acanthaster planci]|uniref:Uncharacterized protein LOC110990259 n=1 Tax=Acanthaster planci TaxID=133434 RepID=A0A8B7ZZ94_ACAPL|nr:uncharacterized protein LOC110990259 [Acanthaster planci]